MSNKVLLETGFLLSLNPKDRHHDWAMAILEKAREKEYDIHISPASLVELSLLLRSRGVPKERISKVLQSIETILNSYSKPKIPPLDFETSATAARLEAKYKELSFFDSLHAATAIVNGLRYLDLDPIISKIVKAHLRLPQR